MFTGIYALQTQGFMSNPFSFFQGARALLPLLAAYLCLIWILAKKSFFPYAKTPLAYIFYYCLIGILSSVFLSPQTITSLYWGGIYLSPLLVIWVILDQPEAVDKIKRLIKINYVIFIMITISLFPQAFKGGLGKISHNQFYVLPLGMGEIRSNGVGRYALVVSIIAFVRFLALRTKTRYLWLVLGLPALFLLIQTQSRTALLGLAVASSLYVFLRRMDWRLIFIGPISSYLIWLSGVKWRFQGEVSHAVLLSGREYTWKKGLAMIEQSPFLGWGFHADRLLLNAEHMHNSYLHSMIHGGLFGGLFFLAAIVSFWAMMIKRNIFKKIISGKHSGDFLLIESILIVGFLTSRSLFESTAAFYGVDLLLIVPSISYLMLWPSKSVESLPSLSSQNKYDAKLRIGL